MLPRSRRRGNRYGGRGGSNPRPWNQSVQSKPVAFSDTAQRRCMTDLS